MGQGRDVPKNAAMSLERRIRETVARGYCDDRNCYKEVDTDLLNSIVQEIMLSIDPMCHPSRRLYLMPSRS
jgi:hypothetical protein